MIIVHANDPTTSTLSQLYEKLPEDKYEHLDENSSNTYIIQEIKNADCIMMLGHGNPYGLFSVPNRKGQYVRHLVSAKHVECLRNKVCIGIWCHANLFAERYGILGLFSGMIISEPQEAVEYNIRTTVDEINKEMEKFAYRLSVCLNTYELCDIPDRLRDLDDVHSELTNFNYNHIYYYKE